VWDRRGCRVGAQMSASLRSAWCFGSSCVFNVWLIDSMIWWNVQIVTTGTGEALPGPPACVCWRSVGSYNRVHAGKWIPGRVGVGGAVAVAGVTGHVGTLHGDAGAAALDWCGIGEPGIVVPAWTVPGGDIDDVLHHRPCVAESFVVGGALRQIGEHGAQQVSA